MGYELTAEEVNRRKPGKYRNMVEGPAVTNWSATHIPYSDMTTKEALEISMMRKLSEEVEDEEHIS